MKEKKNIFHTSKWNAAVAIAVTAVMILITIFSSTGEEMIWQYVCLGMLFAALAGLYIRLDITYGRMLSVLMYLVLPAASFIALEYYSHVLSDLDPLIIVLNLLFFYLLYALMTFLTGSVRVGFSLAALVPMLFGLANYFVVGFRGHPIVPWDFLSFGTAMSVADNYEFTIEWKQGFVLIAFIWIILLGTKSRVKFQRRLIRIGAAGICLALMFSYLTSIQIGSVQSFFGMDTTLFTLNVLYRNNGIAAAFLGNLRFLDLDEPDGYSPERVLEIAAQAGAAGDGLSSADPENGYGDGTENTADQSMDAGKDTDERTAADSAPAEQDVTQYPNIIVIMNEAFSDLSVWGDFAVSEEVMPFFRMMQEEGIGGELYASVKGGNTANAEFEFLTGNTMAFLPNGSVPFQQYLNGETPSLSGYLKSLGYRTLAIHPYNRSGWDRDEVYEYFNFDEFLDIKSFDNPHRMRGYVSDRAAFNKIIQQYNYKAKDERLFVFEVTMQNHGGYSKESPDFESYLKLPEATSKTTSILATEKYLTLMNESDRALQDLIQFFEEQDEPVVVLMFGDHQPSDYITNVIRRLCGVDVPQTLEEVQQGYRVPFMIWSNQGLEPAYYDGISVNYLGGLLMEAAGVPQTGYQKYLEGLMDTLPVITGNVLRDQTGTFYPVDAEEYADVLNDYKILQYNHLVDEKNRVDSFFGG